MNGLDEPRRIALPAPRGELTSALFGALGEHPCDPRGAATGPLERAVPAARDPLADDDLQLALYVCYELHYAEIDGVHELWEWAPPLLAFRARLESAFEAALRALVPAAAAPEAAAVGDTLQRLVREDDGPALARFLETRGTREQMLEHIVHRSAYQLKEADPHTWAVPRLVGAAKAALLEIQADEYGGGRADRMHSTLFAKTMAALGLDARYGVYVGLLPGITLATVNLVSMFGLHRRLRGALAGHMAVFEMTSSVPNRRYGNALRRLGAGAEATDFYDEHVQADAVHESIAAWDLADTLARAEPGLAAQILFGARALLALEGRWAAHLLDAFRAGEGSLLEPLASAPA